MAKSKGITLSKEQKSLIRRLTQKANRRITAAFKLYEEFNQKRIPGALTSGKITVREEWETAKYPLSRKVTFDTQKEFQQRLKWLKTFDVPEAKGGLPTISQFQAIQGNKIIMAMQTSFAGGAFYGLPPELMDEVYKHILSLSPPEQTEFWKSYTKRAQKLLDKFSSKAAMEQALNEFFGKEELRPMLLKAVIEAKGVVKQEDVKKAYDELKHYNNKALVNYLKTLR